MTDKKIIYLSHIIDENTPLYGGGGGVVLRKDKSMAAGDSCNTMQWTFPNHIGTHVDVPRHFFSGGAAVSDYTAEEWVFTFVVIADIGQISPGTVITKDMVQVEEQCDLLLIRTGFEQYRNQDLYWRNSPALHPDLALDLKKDCPGLRAVGVDFISISNMEKRDLGRAAHRAFLNNNIVLVEDMKLSGLKKRPQMVIVAPLIVEKADASPCTVMALER